MDVALLKTSMDRTVLGQLSNEPKLSFGRLNFRESRVRKCLQILTSIRQESLCNFAFHDQSLVRAGNPVC